VDEGWEESACRVELAARDCHAFPTEKRGSKGLLTSMTTELVIQQHESRSRPKEEFTLGKSAHV
jgi:hypothetical protein